MSRQGRGCRSRRPDPEEMLARVQAAAGDMTMNRCCPRQEQQPTNAQLAVCLERQNQMLCDIINRLDWIICRLEEEK